MGKISLQINLFTNCDHLKLLPIKNEWEFNSIN